MEWEKLFCRACPAKGGNVRFFTLQEDCDRGRIWGIARPCRCSARRSCTRPGSRECWGRISLSGWTTSPCSCRGCPLFQCRSTSGQHLIFHRQTSDLCGDRQRCPIILAKHWPHQHWSRSFPAPEVCNYIFTVTFHSNKGTLSLSSFFALPHIFQYEKISKTNIFCVTHITCVWWQKASDLIRESQKWGHKNQEKMKWEMCRRRRQRFSTRERSVLMCSWNSVE